MAQQHGNKKPNPIAAFFGFGANKPPTASSSKQNRKKKQPAPSANAELSGTPVAAHSFSGHFVTFALVLVIIALSVYSPLTSFIKQHQEIKSTKDNIATLEAEKEDLQRQVSLWEDDNYVKQQARSRLFYVEPGETPYLVVGLDPTSELADDTSAAAKTAPEDSWTTKLWGSLQLAATDADTPSAEHTTEPTPTTSGTPTGTSSNSEPTTPQSSEEQVTDGG